MNDEHEIKTTEQEKKEAEILALLSQKFKQGEFLPWKGINFVLYEITGQGMFIVPHSMIKKR